jgi:HAD superfamily hydrolase (TIGR01509 family)
MQCVLFDLDGTLVDSEHLGMRAIVDLLPALQAEDPGTPLVEEFTERYRGRELAATLSKIESRYSLTLADDFVAQYRIRMAQLFESDLKAFSGADEMLSQIKYAKCIASGGPLDKIQRSLRITKLAPHFGDKLFSSYELGSWKPEPNLFLHAASQMGFEPEQCVVIEDSEVGLQAAKAAGMKVFHFCPSGDSDHEVSFSDLMQLPNLLSANE